MSGHRGGHVFNLWFNQHILSGKCMGFKKNDLLKGI